MKFFAFEILKPDGSTYSSYMFAEDEALARRKLANETLYEGERIGRFFEIPGEKARIVNTMSDEEEIRKVLGL